MKKNRNHIFASFHISPFLFFKKNLTKQYLLANAFSCVNMKFSYTIAVLKDKSYVDKSMSYCNENKQFLGNV